MVIAVLAALVAFLQLPGPATCPNLSWRWVALAFEGLDSDPPDELRADSTGETDAVLPRELIVVRRPGHTGLVAAPTPNHGGPDAIVDSSETRAPPAS